MVAIAHIEKFVHDRPEIFEEELRNEILEKARAIGHDPIYAEEATSLLGRYSNTLFRLISSDQRYIHITCLQIIQQRKIVVVIIS